VGIGINPKLAQRIKDSDVLVVVGPRLGEMTTQGYGLIDIPEPAQALVHVHTGVDELGRVYRPTIAINATMPEFARAARALAPVERARWAGGRDQAHADYLAHIKPPKVPGALNPAEIMAWLNETLPEDAILTNGAGNYSVWVHRFYQHKRFRTQLAPTSGAMGYGVPAAIAAKIAAPKRCVVSFSGDGCFMMLGQELATAVQFNANVIFIIFNNNMLATIRMHQERHYPGRVIATDLVNPDFVKLAQAYGAFGARVEKTGDFAGVFQQALECAIPAVIELVLDPQALTPMQTLDEAREQGERTR
jgi:acetolactate synthase-1/2/3 large subunit